MRSSSSRPSPPSTRRRRSSRSGCADPPAALRAPPAAPRAQPAAPARRLEGARRAAAATAAAAAARLVDRRAGGRHRRALPRGWLVGGAWGCVGGLLGLQASGRGVGGVLSGDLPHEVMHGTSRIARTQRLPCPTVRHVHPTSSAYAGAELHPHVPRLHPQCAPPATPCASAGRAALPARGRRVGRRAALLAPFSRLLHRIQGTMHSSPNFHPAPTRPQSSPDPAPIQPRPGSGP